MATWLYLCSVRAAAEDNDGVEEDLAVKESWIEEVAVQVAQWLARPALTASAWIRRGQLAVAVTQDAPEVIQRAAARAMDLTRLPTYGLPAEELIELLMNAGGGGLPDSAELQCFSGGNPRSAALAGFLMAQCFDSMLTAEERGPLGTDAVPSDKVKSCSPRRLIMFVSSRLDPRQFALLLGSTRTSGGSPVRQRFLPLPRFTLHFPFLGLKSA